MSGEPIALKVINKINRKLKLICSKNRFLSPELRRMLCNALIQPHFDYTCPAWYSNLTEKTKKIIQIRQNKCIRFCLRLDKMHPISEEDFWLINCLPTSKRVRPEQIACLMPIRPARARKISEAQPIFRTCTFCLVKKKN